MFFSNNLDYFFPLTLTERLLLSDSIFNPQICKLPNTLVQYDMYRENENLVFDIALAGFSKEDIIVYVEDKVLIVEATKGSSFEENKEKDKTKEFIKNELNSMYMKRKFPFEDNVDVDNINASFENGILKVTLPIINKKDRKNIEIK